jgi:integration host factor subunit beta
MTRAELVDEIARQSSMTRRQAEVVVDAVFDSILDALGHGDKIELRGFGSFRIRRRASRAGRNPRTGADVVVPERRVPHFKPGKELRDLVNRNAE